MDSFRRKEMIYNNYPDDYIVINAKWVEWDNDEQRWCFMTEDAFEKAQSLADYTKQVRNEVLDIIDKKFNCCGYVEEKFEDIKEYILDQLQGESKCLN